ncbi:MAG: AEC family transporter, partial [Anaerolineaceae bacterium]
MFFIFALGFGAQRLRPMGEGTLADLSWLVIDVLLPFYLFYTTSQNASIEALGQAPIVLLAGVFIPFLSLLIAPLLYKPLRVPEKRQSVFSFCILLANTAFLGIPICEALFGPTGAFYAVIYDFGLTVVGFSLGLWLLSGGKFADWKSMLINPLVISVLLGLVVSTTGISFPLWLTKPLSTVGQATLPIALLVAGAQIGNLRFKTSEINPDMGAVIALRLIIVPLVMLGFFLISGSLDLSKNVIV